MAFEQEGIFLEPHLHAAATWNLTFAISPKPPPILVLRMKIQSCRVPILIESTMNRQGEGI
jgi:hypothetical protein